MEKKYWKLHNNAFGNCIGESHIINGNIELRVLYIQTADCDNVEDISSITYKEPYNEDVISNKLFDYDIVEELTEVEYQRISSIYSDYCELCQRKYAYYEELKKLIKNI